MTRLRSVHITSLCCLLLFGISELCSAARPDKDKDGYRGVQSGGSDCVDQYSSVFIEGTTDCDPSRPPSFIDGPFPIADHAWIEDRNGVFHLFHHAGDREQNIFHFSTSDMDSLTPVAPSPALSPAPDSWDSHSIWAPHIVEENDVFFMFYSGTTGPGSDPRAIQRIGLATSTDLAHWSRYPTSDCAGVTGAGCVYDCDEIWTTWNTGEDYDAQCRDPFVLWDEEAGRWVMFVTVRLSVPGSWSEGISVATSTDLVHWTGAGYIEATKRLTSAEGGVLGQLWGGTAENVFVTEYDHVYYLLFTDWHDEEPANLDCADSLCSMVQYATSTSLQASPDGSPNWEYRGYTPDAGVNAIEVVIREGDTWLQTQSVANANSGDWDLHARDLRVKRMVWAPDGSYATSNLTDLTCRVPSAAINPGMPETCDDTIDNDCSGIVDDIGSCPCVDEDGDGYGVHGLLACPFHEFDCDDTATDVRPGAQERCDGIDNDCDGRIEEADTCRRSRQEPAALQSLAGSRPSRATPGVQGASASSKTPDLRVSDARWGEAVGIRYSLGATHHVRLEIFDVAGRRIRTLFDGLREPGEYQTSWNRVDSSGSRVASGIYVVRLLVGNEAIAKKIVSTP